MVYNYIIDKRCISELFLFLVLNLIYVFLRKVFYIYKLHDILKGTHDAKTVSRVTYFTKYQGDFECFNALLLIFLTVDNLTVYKFKIARA